MLIAQVHIQVKPSCIDAFIAASSKNARHSVQEPGIERFDILQSQDDPTSFVLFEVYRSSQARQAHKETAHFLVWRSEVKDLIMAPGRATIYSMVDPAEYGEV